MCALRNNKAISFKYFVCVNSVNLVLILITVGLYFLNNMVLKKYSSGFFEYFFKCHFNDLICPLVFLAYCDILLSTKNKNINKLWQCMIFIFVVGLIWEFFAPLIKAGAVTDYIDIICYQIGATLYWLVRCVTAIKKHTEE